MPQASFERPIKLTASKYVELSIYATAFFGWGVWVSGAPTWAVVSTVVITAMVARVIYIIDPPKQ